MINPPGDSDAKDKEATPVAQLIIINNYEMMVQAEKAEEGG